jgi:hypothetical protein
VVKKSRRLRPGVLEMGSVKVGLPSGQES